MFSDDKTQCTVKKGDAALMGIDSKTYYTDVYDDDKSFALREHPGDVELIYISKIVSGKRILKWREGTEERSIKIEAILLE